MPPKKKAAKKKPEQAKKEPEKGLDQSGIGEYDVCMEYDVRLKDSTGEVVTVKGTLPLSNATIPAFLTDSQRTVSESFEQLVKNRFLLQTRHYFNTLKEEETKKDLPEAPIGQLPGDSAAPTETTVSTDEDFKFESDESESNENNEQEKKD